MKMTQKIVFRRGRDTYSEKLTPEEEQLRLDLVDHMQEVGWKINHEYLDDVAKVEDPENNDVLVRTVWGKHKGDFHLISPCGKYTVRVQQRTAAFWRKEPSWLGVGEYPINEIQLIKDGLQFEFVKIIIN
jgi:hypothetical protein